jgi:hypothetical protein
MTDNVAANWINPNIINHRGHISIKYRGNSSFDASAKKPFSLKTQDETLSNIDVNLLGIGADKDWELIAPYNDRSLIRDMLVFNLMHPYLDYTPGGKYCELVLNGVYQGIYILVAKVDRGDNRIDLPKPGASGNNLTGGYQLEIDRNDEPVFWCNYHPRDLYGNSLNQNTCYQYKYPEYEDYTDGMMTQKSYIENRVHQFEDAVASADFKDAERGYRKEVDVTSLIDVMLAQEFTHNVDGYRLSSPFYKYRDSKDPRFKFTIWDFNISMGNADYYEGWRTEGWQWNMNRLSNGDANMIPFFFKRVLEDEVFRMEMRERWAHFRQTEFSDQSIQNKIDSLQTLLSEATTRNFTAWPYWGSSVWPNYYVSNSWADELNYLKAWIKKRLAWMDSQLLTNMPTNLIRNNSFDSDMKRSAGSNSYIFSSWELNGSVGNSSTLPFNGQYSLSFRANGASAKQILTELDKGKYTLKAWVRTVENPQARVVITPLNGTAVTYTINNSSQFTEITVPDIYVPFGVCDIRFSTNNPSFGGDTRLYLDSVRFFQQFEDNYAYHPDTKVDMPSTNLPIMMYNVTNSFATTGSAETVMSLIYRANGMRNRITDLNITNIQNTAIIPYRGNVHIELIPSADDKKSFVLYTKDAANNYQDVNLLGLGMAHQWKLLASNDDPSFLRGIVSGKLLQGVSELNGGGEALELLINDVYQGIYILVPQQDIAQTLGITSPQSITIDENAFVIDINNNSNVTVLSSPNLDLFGRPMGDFTHYGYVFPADIDRTVQTETFSTQYFDNFAVSTMSAGSGYLTYIDTASFYSYILSMELFRNAEAYRSHLSISKKSNEKLHLNCTDFLSTTGNVPLYDTWSPEGWSWNFNRFDSVPTVPFWFTRLLNNKNFYQGLSRAWSVLRSTHFSNTQINSLVNSWQTKLTEAKGREAKTWEHTYNDTYYQLSTWTEEIANFKQFLLQRAAWLDEQLLNSQPNNLVANGNFEIDMPRNNGGDLLLSSWEKEDNALGNITLVDPFEGNRAYAFLPLVKQTITQIPDGNYQLTFNYKSDLVPFIVSLYAPEGATNNRLIFTDTLASATDWTAATYNTIRIDKGVVALYFAVQSAIPGAQGMIDKVSLTFTGPLGIYTDPATQLSPCKVYPNPFSRDIFFEYSAQSMKSSIKIFTVAGLQIAQLESEGAIDQIRRVRWSAANLASGIYFYQIQDGINIYSGKIVKQ